MSDEIFVDDPDDDWEATVGGWKAEMESMTLAELLAGFGPLADEETP